MISLREVKERFLDYFSGQDPSLIEDGGLIPLEDDRSGLLVDNVGYLVSGEIQRKLSLKGVGRKFCR